MNFKSTYSVPVTWGRLTTLIAATGLVAAAALTAAPGQATATEPPRLLLLGDSITQGYAGDTTWRYRLWDAYAGQVDRNVKLTEQRQRARYGSDHPLVTFKATHVRAAA